MKGLTLVDPDEVRTIFLVLFMIFEPLRLTAGYYGNLKEQVRYSLVVNSWRILLQANSVSLYAQQLEFRCRC